jgi:hypothetical protein
VRVASEPSNASSSHAPVAKANATPNNAVNRPSTTTNGQRCAAMRAPNR